MSRDSFDYSHADTGTKPNTSLNFEQNGRPASENFDWWWYTVIQSINGHAEEFDRLDSNSDGVVDKADNALALEGNSWAEVKAWVNANIDGTGHNHPEYYINDGDHKFIVETRSSDPSNLGADDHGRMWLIE